MSPSLDDPSRETPSNPLIRRVLEDDDGSYAPNIDKGVDAIGVVVIGANEMPAVDPAAAAEDAADSAKAVMVDPRAATVASDDRIADREVRVVAFAEAISSKWPESLCTSNCKLACIDEMKTVYRRKESLNSVTRLRSWSETITIEASNCLRHISRALHRYDHEWRYSAQASRDV